MNITAHKLHQYIRTITNQPTIQKFSCQKQGQKRQTVATAIKFLRIITNNDLAFFIDTIQHRLQRYDAKNSKQLSYDHLMSIYENLKVLHNRSTGNHKLQYLSLIAPFIPYTKLRRDGWDAGRQAYNRVKSGSVPKRKKKSPVKERYQRRILQFLEENSREAANRTYNNIPCRYLNDTIIGLYNRFIEMYEAKVSESTFRSCIPRHYKSARKETDKCNLCEIGRSHKRTQRCYEREIEDLREKKRSRNIPVEEKITTIKSKLDSLQKEINFYSHHLEAKDRQRNHFKQQRENLGSDECQIVVDFKENISIGTGSVETGYDFYNKSHITVFGSVVYYREGDQIKKKRICFFSHTLSHDAIFATGCMDKILDMDWFNFKRIHFWMDCGPHFRCQQMMGWIFGSVRKKKIESSCNFFVEHHGKNECDSMFSTVSMWKRSLESTLPRDERIVDLNQLIDYLRSKVPIEKKDQYEFHEYKEPDPHPDGYRFRINGIKNYYSIKKISKKKRVSLHLYSDDNSIKTKKITLKSRQQRKKTKKSKEYEPMPQKYGENTMKVYKNRKKLEEKSKSKRI